MSASKVNPSSEIESAAAAWIARRDAGMSALDQAELERWKRADPRHVRALARHEQAWAIFDRPLRAGKAEQLAADLGLRAARRRRRRLGATTAALAACVMGLAVWRYRASPVMPFSASAMPASVVIVSPETRTLPDGSVVELRAGSEIEVDFSGELRRVFLRAGEAHFTVARNPARAFVVDASGIEVRAVGTAFAVQMGVQRVRVVVTEGTVAVAPPAGEPARAVGSAPPHAHAATLVDAGRRIVVEVGADLRGAASVEVTKAEMAEHLSWRSHQLEFTGAPLGEAIVLMNRYSRTQMRIEPNDPGLARLEVSGYFRAENTETFLHLIEQTLGLESERVGDVIKLRRTR